MANFRPFAHPWWVNLLLLVPLLAFLLFRRKQPRLTSRSLLACAVFALSFGFVEGAVAIYLGVAVGLLPAHAGTLSDLARLPPDLDGIQAQQFSNLSPGLLRVEIIREAATMLMLLSVAILALEKWRERFAIFLWPSRSGILRTTLRCGSWSTGQIRPQAGTCCFLSQYRGLRKCGFRLL
jgi:hypothetical protein